MSETEKDYIESKFKELISCVKSIDSCLIIVSDNMSFSSLIRGDADNVATMIYNALEDYPLLYGAMLKAMANFETNKKNNGYEKNIRCLLWVAHDVVQQT